jgi:hypothetical protein
MRFFYIPTNSNLLFDVEILGKVGCEEFAVHAMLALCFDKSNQPASSLIHSSENINVLLFVSNNLTTMFQLAIVELLFSSQILTATR